jgi:hypothetical protein
MKKLLAKAIDPAKLQAALECAVRAADGFLIFNQRDRCYQLLFDRRQSPESDPLMEAKQGGCCGTPGPLQDAP